MKELLMTGTALLSFGALSGEKVILVDQTPRVVGDTVHLKEMVYVLYAERSCQLTIFGAERMRAGTVRYGDGGARPAGASLLEAESS